MSEQTIYTKTAKGVLEVRNRTIRLPRELERVFSLVDGKSSVSEILSKSDGMAYDDLVSALTKLTKEGFVKVFSTGPMPSSAAPQSTLLLLRANICSKNKSFS